MQLGQQQCYGHVQTLMRAVVCPAVTRGVVMLFTYATNAHELLSGEIIVIWVCEVPTKARVYPASHRGRCVSNKRVLVIQ